MFLKIKLSVKIRKDKKNLEIRLILFLIDYIYNVAFN